MPVASKSRRHTITLATVAALVVALILLWDWNWFRPIVEKQASAALGRRITLGHFDVKLARDPTIILDRIVVANPDEFAPASQIATVDRLAVTFDPFALFHHRVLLEEIRVDHPQADLKPDAAGNPNWKFAPKSAPSDAKPLDVNIGALIINDGHVHLLDPPFKTDFNIAIHTQPAPNGGESQIVADADGTYSGQPITGHFVGGSVLSLRDAAQPYPILLDIANGPTQLSLKGTVERPLQFGGANLALDFRGSDMALLYPLTSVPFPQTPPFHLKGMLDYESGKIRFKDFDGIVGSSDLSGTIAIEPGKKRRLITANLLSKRVVLADLAGFIGATPGEADAANDTRLQKQERRQQDTNPKLLPDTQINLPKLRSADIDIHYQGARIESDSTPLDNLVANLKVTDGVLSLTPLSFGVGSGSIVGNILLDGTQDKVYAKADVDFRKLDLSHIMNKTSAFKGSGVIGGQAHIDGRGNTVADLVASGDGELKLFMQGGDLSSLLIDLAGLDFGNGVLSALGIPSRAQLRCMVTDFGLKDGQVDTRLLLFDTTEANIIGSGDIDLKAETIDYQLKTEPKHFNIGSLPAPIDIKGPLKKPSILPDAKALGIRGAASVALGILATPLAALIPTIQLGLGEDNDCGALLKTVQDAGTAKPAAAN